MVAGISSTKSYGFENLMLSGLKQQYRDTSAALREGKGKEQQSPKASQSTELSPEDLRVVDQLRATDRRVRAHEQAHVAVGADLVRGGASFAYETGPDRKRYAVAGEVSIDTSKERTPEATIPKAQHIRATALAPADPSAQDRQVASLASRMEIEARQEAAMQAAEERARAGSQQASRAIGAYQETGGLELSAGFSAEA